MKHTKTSIMKHLFLTILIAIITLTATAQQADNNRRQAPSPEEIAKQNNITDSLNNLKMLRPTAGSTRKGNNPVLFLVGNSTMRQGTRGNGDIGQWGWGFYFGDYFDSEKITVENHALGGMSTRSFYNVLWNDVLAGIKKGDWVFIELGHNDNGAYEQGRSTIRGIGRDSAVVTLQRSGETETVYSYGEYLRRYIAQVKAKGANPVLLSLTPRNSWNDKGKIVRVNETFGLWARQIAAEQKIPFIDLNEITASKYEIFGQKK
jgi:lysophospholipase L1-like esterase